MCKLNQSFEIPRRPCPGEAQIPPLVLGLMLLPAVSGEADVREHWWTSESSTLKSQYHPIDQCFDRSGSTRGKRFVLTDKGYEKWSMLLSSLLWCLLLAAFRNKLQTSTNDWPPCWQTNGTNPTAPPCTGWDVPYPLACSGLPFSAYVGPRNEAITSGPGYSRGQLATELTNLTIHAILHTLFYYYPTIYLLPP